MVTLLQQIFTLLTTPPGNLVYHLVLAFSVVASLQSVVIGRTPGVQRRARRMLLALMIILVLQLIVFISSGLVWQGLANPQLFLPPLDRAVALLSLIWIAWLWIFPDANRTSDALVSVLTMAVVVLFLVNLASWMGQPSAAAFNGSLFDQIWSVAGLLVSFAALLLLGLRHPEQWAIGLGFFTLNLMGYLAHWLWSPAGQDFAGLIRLAQLSTYPLLPTLARRLHEAPVAFIPAETGVNATRRRAGADARTIQAWLELAAEKDSGTRLERLLRAIAQSMLADLCLLVSNSPESDEVMITGGYDLIREEPISRRSLNNHEMAIVASSLQRGRPIRLSPEDSDPDDLRNFAEVMDLKESGYLLGVPISLPSTEWAGLILLSPYSNRSWTVEDQSALLAMTGRVSQILLSAETKASSAPESNPLIAQLEQARQDLAAAHIKNQELISRMGIAQAPEEKQASGMDALLALQKEAQETIARLQAENYQLQSTVRKVSLIDSGETASQQVEGELRLALQEVAHLRNELGTVSNKLFELEQQAGASEGTLPSEEDREMITSLIQEIRQPLSSIIGYTDLLMGESVGILGALQQKFLERIKTSSERMSILLEDLLQVSQIQNGSLELAIQPIELDSVVDQVVADLRNLIREKSLSLRIDLPENLPKINADRDAVQQIIMHLVQNAREVTPQDGTISIKSRVQKADSGAPLILLQVTDMGGGVPTDDLPRVFSRIYRADHPLIPGIGDSGIGLSIAKTLVQALGGKIWVDSLQEKSTTFSVLFPVDAPQGNGSRKEQ